MSAPDALVASLMEIERHVAGLGWDQPARLFALVPTVELIEARVDAIHLGLDLGDGADQDRKSVV